MARRLAEAEHRNQQLTAEIEVLRRRLAESGQELGVRVNGYEQRIAAAAREVEESRRRLQEYEEKGGAIAREVERLNGLLRGKMEEIANWDAKYRQVLL